MLQYFLRVLYFCEVCECLSITNKRLQIIKHIDLWEWLLVGVVIMNKSTIDDKLPGMFQGLPGMSPQGSLMCVVPSVPRHPRVVPGMVYDHCQSQVQDVH